MNFLVCLCRTSELVSYAVGEPERFRAIKQKEQELFDSGARARCSTDKGWAGVKGGDEGGGGAGLNYTLSSDMDVPEELDEEDEML